MNIQEIKPALLRRITDHRKGLRVAALIVGVLFLASAVAVRTVEGAWSPLSVALGVLMGIAEVCWLMLEAPTKETKPNGPRLPAILHYLFAAGVFILLTVAVPLVPRSDGEAAGGAVGPSVLMGVFFGLIFLMALYFAVELWRALVRTPAGAALTGQPMGRGPVMRFDVWYAWTGSIVYGCLFAALLPDGLAPKQFVPLVAGLLIVVVCILVTRGWAGLGDAQRDGTKFLLRQSALTVLLAFAVAVDAFGFETGLESTVLGAATTMLLINAAEVGLLAHRSRRNARPSAQGAATAADGELRADEIGIP